MEGMPNNTPNQMPDESDEQSVDRREAFSVSWQRFRGQFSELSLETVVEVSGYNEEEENARNERDDDDDEVDDLLDGTDDSDDEASESDDNPKVTSKPRRRNLWKRPDKPVEQPKQADNDLDGVVDEPVAESELEPDYDSNENEIADELSGATEEAEESNDPNIPLTPISQILQDRADRGIVSPSNSGNNGGQLPPTVPPIPPHAYNRSYSGGGNVPPMPPVSTPNQMPGQNVNVINNTTHVHENRRHRHAGLIAIDILNYGLALRRDNKNKRLSDRKMKRLSEEVKKSFKRNEQASYSQKAPVRSSERIIYDNVTRVEERVVTNSNQLKSVEIITTEDSMVSRKSEQNNGADHKIHSISLDKQKPKTEVFYSRSDEVAPKRVEKVEAPVPPLSPDQLRRIAELSGEYQKVPVATDTPAISSNGVQPSWLKKPTIPAVNLGDRVESFARGIEQSGSSSTYKQFVIPSISGIIAGIIVFLILYMLTMS